MCHKNNLEEFLDMGHHPPSDAFLTKEESQQHVTHYPLKTVICLDCGLSQLNYVVPPEILYRRNYPYESSTTKSLTDYYNKFAESVVKRFDLKEDDLVIDIGSNVGVLLGGFKNNRTKVLGIDPAENIVEMANERGITTVCEFFGEGTAKKIRKGYGEASVITGTNIFAHVDDLDDFMKGEYHAMWR